MKKWRSYSMVMLILVGALFLVACGATGEAEQEISTLRIGTTDLWDTINPLTGWEWGPRVLLYDRLTSAETITSVREGLAKSWEVSDDGLVWTFEIQEGVTFHDGSPCTAEDIAWNINWYIENQFPAMEAYISGFTEAIALDDTTLQITLEEPMRSMLSSRVIFTWIVPRSVWGDMSYDEATGYNELDAAIGTGPYKAVEYVEDEYMILEAYEDYWRGKPNIDRVIFQIYATEDAMVQAMLGGEIDMIDVVPVQAIEVLEEGENIEVATLPALSTQYLIINSYENGTQHESLKDPAVRLAIAHATDKQQIINTAFYGYAEPATIPAPPGFGDLHNPNIEDIPFDLEEGNRILEEAGYVDSDGDGIREGKDGEPLEYRMYTDSGAQGIRMLEVIAAGLEGIGIKAYPQEIDDMSTLYPDYDFDLAHWNWSWDPDIEESLRAYTCAEVPDGWNDAGWCSEEYDALYAKQADISISDDERREIIWEMQEMFFDALPYVTVAYDVTIAAYRSDRFTNFDTESFDTIWYPKSILQAEPVE